MTNNDFTEVSAGEILLTEFLEPLGISGYKLAKETGLTPTCVSQILHGKRKITPTTSLKIDKYLNLPEGYFLRIQMSIDLRKAKYEQRIQQEKTQLTA